MITHESTLRVRYAETDQMGVVYHGNFLAYFEAARGEMSRDFGMGYGELEAEGIFMPVTEVQIKYLRPVRYDELITLRCMIDELPTRRLVVRTDVYGPDGRKCVEGVVTLAFVDRKTGKTVDAPVHFIQLLEANWKQEK